MILSLSGLLLAIVGLALNTWGNDYTVGRLLRHDFARAGGLLLAAIGVGMTIVAVL